MKKKRVQKKQQRYTADYDKPEKTIQSSVFHARVTHTLWHKSKYFRNPKTVKMHETSKNNEWSLTSVTTALYS